MNLQQNTFAKGIIKKLSRKHSEPSLSSLDNDEEILDLDGCFPSHFSSCQVLQLKNQILVALLDQETNNLLKLLRLGKGNGKKSIN